MAHTGNHNDEPGQSEAEQGVAGHNITSMSQQSASQAGSSSKQPSLRLLSTDGVQRSEPVSFQPPAPLARPKRTIRRSMGKSSGPTKYSRSIEKDVPFCARSSRNKTSTIEVTVLGGPGVSGVSATSEVSRHVQYAVATGTGHGPYIVVGIMGKEESVPRETLLLIRAQEDLFRQIRNAERRLRNPFQRLLSLKRVGGFGLYRCHPSQDYHSNPNIGDETKRCLAELYRNYRTEKRDYQDRWMTWIHDNFNNGSHNHENGTYALQLLLKWSPIKLIIWSSVPIVLSVVIGLWYMIRPYPGEDHVAVVQTAWTISSYIVTTAALALAIVAAITQFGD